MALQLFIAVVRAGLSSAVPQRRVERLSLRWADLVVAGVGQWLCTSNALCGDAVVRARLWRGRVTVMKWREKRSDVLFLLSTACVQLGLGLDGTDWIVRRTRHN